VKPCGMAPRERTTLGCTGGAKGTINGRGGNRCGFWPKANSGAHWQKEMTKQLKTPYAGRSSCTLRFKAGHGDFKELDLVEFPIQELQGGGARVLPNYIGACQRLAPGGTLLSKTHQPYQSADQVSSGSKTIVRVFLEGPLNAKDWNDAPKNTVPKTATSSGPLASR